jgi:hypothetical protein
MVRGALSALARRQKIRVEKDKRMEQALAAWDVELAKPDDVPRYPQTFIAEKYGVKASTLWARINGRPGISDFNKTKQKLTVAEELLVKEYLLAMAARGLPLTNRMLREKAEAILSARLGLPMHLNKGWSRYFLNRHDGLKSYWSKPLERARANGLNPPAVKVYFDTIEPLLTSEDDAKRVPPGNTYGVDESGFNLGLTSKQKVIGGAGQKGQHSRVEGTRENITVIETICADGTCLKPTVIFKAKNLWTSWMENNPDDAR